MSNNKIFNSSDLGDIAGRHVGLFDRIINLKFYRADGTTFTLRSDYEPVWANNRLYFKPCHPKPDIRVTYKQYPGAVISIDVFVANLNILDDNALNAESIMSSAGITTSPQIQGEYTNMPNDTLTALGNKQIKEIEIEMGYRGQMFDWSKYDSSVVRPDVAYAAFQNLEQIQFTNMITQDDRLAAAELADTQLLFQSYRRCVMTIQQAFNSSNPPDRVTQFQGYIGAADKGLAPFAFQTLADPSSEAAGTEAILTKWDIMAELDDRNNPIELVDTDNVDMWNVLTKNDINVHRNLFNGGKPFSLLEAFCFHAVTRRFVKSNIKMKRNELLEQAAVEYSQQLKNNLDTLKDIEQYQNNIMQMIYKEEWPSNREYFAYSADSTFNNRTIVLTDKAPESYKEALDKKAKKIIAEQNVGARYTIKNLPQYHQLYKAIRNRLAEAALKKQYMSWWAAALNLKAESVSINDLNYGVVGNTIEDIRNYTLGLHAGNLQNIDCYIDTLFGKEWIVPMQTMHNSIPAKNTQGLEIQVTAPTKVTSSGFDSPGPLQSMKCFTGLFEVRDAYLFGVPILCSQKASDKFSNIHSTKDIVQIQFFADCKSQIDWICKTWELNHYKLHNGGFFLYDPTENARMISSQAFISEQSIAPFKIPAIYDFTLSTIRTIRMPFAGFLDPFTTIEWNSASAIGEMVSFYYQPNKGKNLFLVLWNEIDFSTVGDFNTMTLSVTDTADTKPDEIPSASTTTGAALFYRDVIIIPDTQLNSWQKIHDSIVTKIPINMVKLWPADDTDKNMNITEDKRASNFQFFRQMYNWNADLFDQAVSNDDGYNWEDIKDRIDSEADKLYGGTVPELTMEGGAGTLRPHFPKLDYCMNKLTDPSLKRIYMTIPMMPTDASYTNMKNIDENSVVVYNKGTWYLSLKSDLSEYKIGVS